MITFKKHLDIEIFEGKIIKHRYPWHFHNSYTIIIVESGEIIYEFQDNIIKVGKAEVLILEPQHVHRNIITQPTIYKALFVPLEYFESDGQTKIATHKLDSKVAVEMMVALLNMIELKYSKKTLTALIHKLCGLINNPDQGQKGGASSLTTGFIPEINHNLPIKKLAEEAHLSKFHFQRKFKKNCGLTIGQLKQQEKTIKAKFLLENGKFPTDVAYELGYFDQSHFIKYFRKMWVVTPKYFKK